MNLLRRIKTTFTYMDVEMMKILISSLIRPRLEYAAVVWSPQTKKNIRKLERVHLRPSFTAPLFFPLLFLTLSLSTYLFHPNFSIAIAICT